MIFLFWSRWMISTKSDLIVFHLCPLPFFYWSSSEAYSKFLNIVLISLLARFTRLLQALSNSLCLDRPSINVNLISSILLIIVSSPIRLEPINCTWPKAWSTRPCARARAEREFFFFFFWSLENEVFSVGKGRMGEFEKKKKLYHTFDVVWI